MCAGSVITRPSTDVPWMVASAGCSSNSGSIPSPSSPFSASCSMPCFLTSRMTRRRTAANSRATSRWLGGRDDGTNRNGDSIPGSQPIPGPSFTDPLIESACRRPSPASTRETVHCCLLSLVQLQSTSWPPSQSFSPQRLGEIARRTNVHRRSKPPVVEQCSCYRMQTTEKIAYVGSTSCPSRPDGTYDA